MSSSNKTNRIGLNEWVGTDVPKMEDFNADNARLDKTLGNHLDDISIHVTSAQKDSWNKIEDAGRNWKMCDHIGLMWSMTDTMEVD